MTCPPNFLTFLRLCKTECHKMTWTPEWLAKFFLSDKNTADKALDLHLDDCTMVRRCHAMVRRRRHATL